MPKDVIIDWEKVGELRSMNLHGLNPDKLRKIIEEGSKTVDLVDDDKGGLIILNGTHSAYHSFTSGESVRARLWNKGEPTNNPLVNLNLSRAERFSDTTSLLGIGRIKDLKRE